MTQFRIHVAPSGTPDTGEFTWILYNQHGESVGAGSASTPEFAREHAIEQATRIDAYPPTKESYESAQ